MLDLPRYLLGVLEVLLLGGFAWLGASAMRAWLVPDFSGAPAHLATAVIALALLTLTAEILGSFGLFELVPYLVVVALVGLGLRVGVVGGWGRPSGLLGFSPGSFAAVRGRHRGEKEDAAAPEGHPHPPTRNRSTGQPGRVVAIAALAIAAVALVKFGLDVRSKLNTGMTGFDSTWYHGPFAAGFLQSGNTWDLHFIAPQFLAWFYPANAEIFHAAGMLAFGRDVLSPLLNLGWFAGCLVACWCIGRPYRVAPWSLVLGAIALSLPVLSDQAGEARNDIVGIFFLLAAVAVAINAVANRRAELELGALAVAGLAAGLAAGTKLNFLLPAAVLVLGLPLLASVGKRLRALAVMVLAALASGGYWYLRNLIHTGNPLPWFDHVGPIPLPAPEQALGGREGHTVVGYLTDGSVWSEWFLPGLHSGLTILWPLLASLAIVGLLLCFRSRDRVLWIAGLTGIAVVAAWLIAPTSASGPDGMPRGFESGLRYLAPALVLGLALFPPVRSSFGPYGGSNLDHAEGMSVRGRPLAAGLALAALVAIAIGYPVQRHYLRDRYANPTFAAPGLNAAFKWADGIADSRIATTSTRQYPLYGRDLSNHVQYIGEEQSHGGFTAPASCSQWRRLLDEGHYDYVVTSRDRIEPDKPPFPATARWTESAQATPILRIPPTVVFKLKGSLSPSVCGRPRVSGGWHGGGGPP